MGLSMATGTPLRCHAGRLKPRLVSDRQGANRRFPHTPAASVMPLTFIPNCPTSRVRKLLQNANSKFIGFCVPRQHCLFDRFRRAPERDSALGQRCSWFRRTDEGSGEGRRWAWKVQCYQHPQSVYHPIPDHEKNTGCFRRSIGSNFDLSRWRSPNALFGT